MSKSAPASTHGAQSPDSGGGVAVSFAEDHNYEIRPPSTSGDKGQPSDSVLSDVRRVLLMIEDERHLSAYKLYQSVLERIKEYSSRKQQETGKQKGSMFRRKHSLTAEDGKEAHDYRAAQGLLSSKHEVMENLERKTHVLEKARDMLQQDEDWILSQTMFGITTYYRREADESLSIKIDGSLEGVPLFEQVCVLKEVDLHHKWAPFCSSSMTIQDLDKLDTVGWFLVGLPSFGLARDGIFRAVGCDNIEEDGSIILAGQGVADRSEDESYAHAYLAEVPDDLDLPPPPKRMGSGRMTIRNFSALIHVLSPTKVNTRVVANINPNLQFLPQSLLDFLMRKLCGILLSKLQHAAKKAYTDPVKNAHAKRMRREEEFYKGWLMPKFQALCKQMGWVMPAVPAFDLTEAELGHELSHLVTSFSEDDQQDHPYDDRLSASAPVLRGGGIDDESTAALSSTSNTSSIFTTNPIAQYLREMEAKTKRKKAKKIAEARQRATNRLKPKNLAEDKRVRLEELKRAKARRLAGNRGTSIQAKPRMLVVDEATSSGQEGPSVELVARETDPVPQRKLFDSLIKHGWGTRLLVTSVLVGALFMTLYADSLMGFDTVLTSSDPRWWMRLVLDGETVLFLGVSALMHFAVCYVSVVYAFDALELGMKSGHRTKHFYGDTALIIVALSSAAIVAVSIGRAISSVWLRATIWYFLKGIHISRNYFSGTNMSLRTVSDWFNSLAESNSLVATGIHTFSGVFLFGRVVTGYIYFILASATHWLQVIFVQSNFVGHLVEYLLLSVWGLMVSLVSSWNAYVNHVVDMYEDDEVELSSWRGAAIETAQSAFSYTAIFLLSILFLFNASAKSTVAGLEEGEADDKGQQKSETASPTPSAQTSLSSNARDRITPQQERKFQSQHISSLTEVFEDEEMSLSVTQSTVGERDANGHTKKKKRFRLRLRKRKLTAPASSSVSPTSQASSPTSLRHSETY